MESIADIKQFDTLDFQKHAGIYKSNDERLLYTKKINVVRLFDEDHVIKKAGNNIEYLTLLQALNIDGVNTPSEIYANGRIPGTYFIVSKYLKNAIDLEYYNRKTDSFEPILNIFINLMKILKSCHDNNFYLFDIHSGNVLIDENAKPYYFDFDRSLFIKDNKLILESISAGLSHFLEDNFVKECFTRCFGEIDGLQNFYMNNADLLVNFFEQFDKEYSMKMFLDIIYMRLKCDINPYCKLDKNDINKLGLSRSFTKKLRNTFIYGEPFAGDEYFLDELEEMQKSRLARKLSR